MTTEEFKKKIAESKHAEWCNEVTYDLHTVESDEAIELKGLNAMYDFATQQLAGWEKVNDDLPERLRKSQSYFTTFKTLLIDFISNYIDSNYYNTTESIQSQWEPAIRRAFSGFRGAVFLFNSPETAFLIKLDKELPGSFDGAWDFILEVVDFSHAEDQSQYLTGTLLAYEFKTKDKSLIVERRATEESSFQSLRDTLLKQLNDSSVHFTQYQSNIHKLYDQSIDQIDKLRNEKEASYNKWFQATQKDFTAFDSAAKSKTGDLEKTYAELLRLKKPAEYWAQRASRLKKEGWKAAYWMIGLVVIISGSLYCLLWMTPEGMLRSFFNGETVAIKWSVIYITLISFLAYIVRAIHKIAFSSFHLARDAEEREQLTHVYLALIKDAAVDEKDKHLILQSLFSRADTGLLKDDSGPTMPGTMIEKAGKT